ncbi:MAG: hypothetical protein PVF15_05740 [Candidatus Bathyarchaeota archaeon]
MVKLAISERIFEALGWIGLAAIVLTIVGVIATIATATLLDWEFGVSLLLASIIIISFGVFEALYFFLHPHYLPAPSAKFVRCHYCNMKNPAEATFCMKCEKPLTKDS